MAEAANLITSVSPGFGLYNDWAKYRLTYEGGVAFRNAYLKAFSTRENPTDFENRRAMTPIPTHAAAAINEIRNSIFQRFADIQRSGGSESYKRAVAGLDLGVDRRGATMNYFIGVEVLLELLIQGKVGVYVDNTTFTGNTLADSYAARPYLYSYPVEQIRGYACNRPGRPSEFSALLLEDRCERFDQNGFQSAENVRFRKLWIDEVTGKVNLQFFDKDGAKTAPDGTPGDEIIRLDLDRIPFVLLDIKQSLLKDASEYQIAMLNLVSSDVSYVLKANFPFLVRQRDMRGAGQHLKPTATHDGTSTTGGQGAADRDLKIGAGQGMEYDKELEAPGFIHPSSEPLIASMKLQDKLEQDIRKIINLAVTDLGVRASAESKKMDNKGLESGLSFIGFVLENAERLISEHWAAYEEKQHSKRAIPVIKYPDNYQLQTDSDRVDSAATVSKLMFTLPGKTVKREIAKLAAERLFRGRIQPETMDTILKEIDEAKYLTSDPETIIQASEAGLVGDETASEALGFEKGESTKAHADHAARLARIAEAQQPEPDEDDDESDPAARGLKDMSASPKAGKDEKAESRDRTQQGSRRRRVRGRGRFPKQS